MADVRDILGVPRGAAASADKGDAPAKPKEQKMLRPAGMSREAFALLGGSHPIVPSVLTEELRKKEDLKGLKQKRKSSAKGQVCLLSPSLLACEGARTAKPSQRPCKRVIACKGMCMRELACLPAGGCMRSTVGKWLQLSACRACACRSPGGGRALQTLRAATGCSCSTG